MFTPRGRPVWFVSLSTAACVLCAATRSNADDARVTIALTYHASSGCPSQNTFKEAVNARTRQAVWTTQVDVTNQTLEIILVSSEGKFDGYLRMGKVGEQRAARDISGATCDEVMSALALVAALAIDPNALTQQLPVPPAAPGLADNGQPQSPSGAADSAVTGLAPMNTTSAPAQPGANVPATANGFASITATSPPTIARRSSGETTPYPRLGSAPQSPWARTPNERVWRLAVGSNGNVVLGISPSAAVSGAAFLELAQFPGLLVPTFRLDVTASRHSWEPAGPGLVNIIWLTSAIEACPMRLSVGGGVSLVPCGFGEVGMLRSQGRIVGESEITTKSRPWVSFGAIGRIQWFPRDHLFVEVQAGLRLPWARDTLIFNVPERTEAYRVPTIGGQLGLGLGYRF